MDVHVSPDAAKYIAGKGGRVYVWSHAVGDFGILHTSTSDPGHRRFIPLDPPADAHIEILESDDLNGLPGEVWVTGRKWPLHGIEATSSYGAGGALRDPFPPGGFR